MNLFCPRCQRMTWWSLICAGFGPDRPGNCLACDYDKPCAAPPAPAIKPDLSNCHAWYPHNRTGRS
jgi:hypothetical protein